METIQYTLHVHGIYNTCTIHVTCTCTCYMYMYMEIVVMYIDIHNTCTWKQFNTRYMYTIQITCICTYIIYVNGHNRRFLELFVFLVFGVVDFFALVGLNSSSSLSLSSYSSSSSSSGFLRFFYLK